MDTQVDKSHDSDRDAKTGRFVTGNIGGGRPKGSRNLLTTAFLDDLRDTWEEHGKQALVECATKDPSQFCRIVAQLLPRYAEIDVTHRGVFAEMQSVDEIIAAVSLELGEDKAEILRRSLLDIAREEQLTIEHDSGATNNK